MTQTPVTPTTTDVIVIGAGVAGLVAATELRKSGFDVRVLEARSGFAMSG